MEKVSRRDLLRSMSAISVCTLTTRGGVVADESRAPYVGMNPGERANARLVVVEYLQRTAPALLRPPMGIMKHPSISPSIPGKDYSAELWDWDTYWCALGLFRLARDLNDSVLHRRVCQHAAGSLEIFFEHQNEEGRIPIMVSTDKQDIFNSLSLDSPNPRNQAKPVMAQIALLVANEKGEAQWFEPLFDSLLRFYESWEKNNRSHIGLFVWGNDVAIGDDNDPTTYGRPSFSSANLMLNCLFYEEFKAAAALAHRLDRVSESEKLTKKYEQLGSLIQKYCWDPCDHFYYTVDVQCHDDRAELIKGRPMGMSMSWACLPLRIQMFTGFLPMWCRVATQEQADAIVNRYYKEDDRFRASFGVRSLSLRETMYSLETSSNPSNWLGPIWIIVNYFVWEALQNYGYGAEASELADKTLKLLSRDVLTSGAMSEYYHPDSGEPLSFHGFIDWNLLILNML